MTIHLLIYASLWCFGFHVVFGELVLKSIFTIDIEEEWHDLPKWFKMMIKPLFACPPCMASLHGSIIHLMTGGSMLMLIPFIVCLCGLNYIVSMVINSGE